MKVKYLNNTKPCVKRFTRIYSILHTVPFVIKLHACFAPYHDFVQISDKIKRLNLYVNATVPSMYTISQRYMMRLIIILNNCNSTAFSINMQPSILMQEL